MAGLLDFNDPGIRMGLGLLALGQAPRAQSAQGLAALFASQDSAAQAQADNAWKQAQIARQQQEWQRQDKENALASQFFKPATQGLAPLSGDSSTGILPSAGRPGMPASFDMPGYAQAMMAVNPQRGLQLMQAMQKELPVDKISPEKFTPASLAKFAQSRNYGDLVPRDKLEFVEGVGVNPYDQANANRSIPNPNKPFQMAPDGSLVPNKAYQQYELSKAAAGAARTNVSVNTEKSLLNEIAGGVGKQVDASLSAAKGAASTINTLNNLDAALNSGKIMAGPATAPAQIVLQLGTQLGLGGKNSQETLQNTRAAMQAMAQLELDAAGTMKGQGQITESERAILRKAASGDINMTLPELKTLSAVSRRTAQARIQQHNQNVQPLLQNPNAAAVAPFLTVQPPQGGAAGGNIIDFGSLK
ncbi:hypothetical protein J2W88_003913 [Acidovorax delafieldii]|uniref:Uncharacterized protein n=1 Tax=Acidovorax delafieldii TaxID=47920 RepID=A0AAJ2BZY4_ACIDE|nr:hypothetical protein [Acidovorax delafieldii]MDR6768609.1 hypothetical protein [Acidovorax delafieldii]MDR6837324.1 hypothetical protein [Acidovorax delafieldii]MDR7366815.1 hypothetical protein [Acidovorax delafieldii]